MSCVHGGAGILNMFVCQKPSTWRKCVQFLATYEKQGGLNKNLYRTSLWKTTKFCLYARDGTQKKRINSERPKEILDNNEETKLILS